MLLRRLGAWGCAAALGLCGYGCVIEEGLEGDATTSGGSTSEGDLIEQVSRRVPSQADVFDDFDRLAESGQLGRTPIGNLEWNAPDYPPDGSLGALRLASGRSSSIALDGLAIHDLMLGVELELGQCKSPMFIGYRTSLDPARGSVGGQRLMISRSKVWLETAGESMAEADIDHPASRVGVRIAVQDDRHVVLIDGQRALDIEVANSERAGTIELGGSCGAFDNLAIWFGTEGDTSTTGEAPQRRSGGGGGRPSTPGSGPGQLGADEDPAAASGSSTGGGTSSATGETDDPTDEYVWSGSTDTVDIIDEIRGAVAPDLDLTVPTSLYKDVRFLFEGTSPEQTGFDPQSVDPIEVALLHGMVTDEDGDPLSDVDVWVLNHPEWGSTVTRSDGTYDLVVAGGRSLTVVLSTPGYLTVHRGAKPGFNDTVRLQDASMLQVDVEDTLITFTDPIEVHLASSVTDEDGTRQAAVLFRQGTVATMVFPDETTAPLASMTVRATEYTFDEAGPDRMPAALPSGTQYTYAVEISADEAEAAGAASVTLDPPAAFYVDNFLDWPVGYVVPAGTYNRQTAHWDVETDGRVIEVTDIVAGEAELDYLVPAGAHSVAGHVSPSYGLLRWIQPARGGAVLVASSTMALVKRSTTCVEVCCSWASLRCSSCRSF